jgi:hypothetical protein
MATSVEAANETANIRSPGDVPLEYMLLLIHTAQQPSSKPLLEELRTVRKAALALASELTANYIWQRDAFNVEIKTDHGD